MKVKITGALVLVSVLTAAWLASHGYTTFATPFCAEGATNVTTAAQVQSAVAAGQDVCVTAAITEALVLEQLTATTTATATGDLTSGSVDVTNVVAGDGALEVGMRITGPGIPGGTRIATLGTGVMTLTLQATATDTAVDFLAADDRQIGTSEGGSLGYIEFDTVAWVTVNARFRSTRIDDTSWIWIDNSIAGGTQDDRTFDQIIFMPSANSDARISNSDIGWTLSDDDGNTGYGCRCYGDLDRLEIVGNRFHDITGDAINGVGGGEDVLIDRNEIGPVGPNPDSIEHSDNIQITGHGPGLRITNNWIHGNGYFDGERSGNAGATYIHGTAEPDINTVLYENNLVEDSFGRVEVCGLGTPTPPDIKSGVTMRNNTFRNLALARDIFGFFQGLEWDCNVGTGNTIAGNIAVDVDGGFAMDGTPSTVTLADNLFGTPDLVTFDDDGNCTSTNCNPEGEDPIGYRKPSGVNW